MKEKYDSLEISIVIMNAEDIITSSPALDENKDVTGNDIYNVFWE